MSFNKIYFKLVDNFNPSRPTSLNLISSSFVIDVEYSIVNNLLISAVNCASVVYVEF